MAEEPETFEEAVHRIVEEILGSERGREFSRARARAFGPSKTPLGQDLALMGAWGVGSTSQAGAVNGVMICPVWVPTWCTIDEINCYCNTASAGNNFRIGVYAIGTPDVNSPLGAALLGESGDIAAAVGTLRYSPATPIPLERGYNWLALAAQDAVMNFARHSNTSAFFAGGVAPMLDGCRYDLGGWGALTDPCPAVVTNPWARVGCALHTLLWRE